MLIIGCTLRNSALWNVIFAVQNLKRSCCFRWTSWYISSYLSKEQTNERVSAEGVSGIEPIPQTTPWQVSPKSNKIINKHKLRMRKGKILPVSVFLSCCCLNAFASDHAGLSGNIGKHVIAAAAKANAPKIRVSPKTQLQAYPLKHTIS